LKDPTDWMDDLEIYLEDKELAETAAAIAPTLVYEGSTPGVALWISIVGVLTGILGAVTLSPDIRHSTIVFIAYLIGAGVVLRVLHPLTKKLLGTGIAWAAAQAMFWAFLLGLFAVIGARLDSPFWGYMASAGLGAFIGLMCGSLAPTAVRREDAWLMTALPLGLVSCVLATYVSRTISEMTDITAAAAAGAIAGGLFTIPLAVLLVKSWDKAHGLGRMGLLYLHNENFSPKALSYLDQAVALAPNDATLYNLRGVAHSRMNQPDLAAADWKKALALKPGDPEPHVHRGVDLLRRNAFDEAAVALQTALMINPRHAKAHANLGTVYERQDRFAEAIEHYDRAVAMMGDYADAYANRAYVYLRKGDHKQALADCEQALEINPDSRLAAVKRGQVLAALGRHEEAEESYRVALDPDTEPTLRDEALRGLEALAGTR
jgi:Tfp pilus assembly protein PilF